jgi:hypothetical protein
MNDKKIVDTILRWVKLADEKKDCDELAQTRFKEIKDFIEQERKRREEAGGGWL